MVKILLPQLPESYSIDDGFSSSYALKYEEPENASPTHTSIISSSRTYSLFTCVYSYGKEIVKFDEDGIQLNQDREFIPDFGSSSSVHLGIKVKVVLVLLSKVSPLNKYFTSQAPIVLKGTRC